MNYIEFAAVVFGLLCVLLTVRQNILCWPAGLVQVLLYIFIFYNVKLYSDLILHIVYVVLQIYGWYAWLHGGAERTELEVSVLDRNLLILWSGIAVVGTILWGAAMARWTDAALPYGDAFTTVASLIATWLMAKKKLESWFFWIAVDVVAIGVYYIKDLYMTTGLYAVFLVLATLGYFAWRKSLFQQPAEETP